MTVEALESTLSDGRSARVGGRPKRIGVVARDDLHAPSQIAQHPGPDAMTRTGGAPWPAWFVADQGPPDVGHGHAGSDCS